MPPDDLFCDVATTFRTFSRLSFQTRHELLCLKHTVSVTSEEERDLMARWTNIMLISWETRWPALTLRFLGAQLLSFKPVSDFIVRHREAVHQKICFEDLHEEFQRAVRHQDMKGKYDELLSTQGKSWKICTAGDAILTFCLLHVGTWSLSAWAFQQESVSVKEFKKILSKAAENETLGVLYDALGLNSYSFFPKCGSVLCTEEIVHDKGDTIEHIIALLHIIGTKRSDMVLYMLIQCLIWLALGDSSQRTYLI